MKHALLLLLAVLVLLAFLDCDRKEQYSVGQAKIIQNGGEQKTAWVCKDSWGAWMMVSEDRKEANEYCAKMRENKTTKGE